MHLLLLVLQVRNPGMAGLASLLLVWSLPSSSIRLLTEFISLRLLSKVPILLPAVSRACFLCSEGTAAFLHSFSRVKASNSALSPSECSLEPLSPLLPPARAGAGVTPPTCVIDPWRHLQSVDTSLWLCTGAHHFHRLSCTTSWQHRHCFFPRTGWTPFYPRALHLLFPPLETFSSRLSFALLAASHHLSIHQRCAQKGLPRSPGWATTPRCWSVSAMSSSCVSFMACTGSSGYFADLFVGLFLSASPSLT